MGPDEAPAFDHLPIHNRHSWQRLKKKQNDQPEMSKQEKKKLKMVWISIFVLVW